MKMQCSLIVTVLFLVYIKTLQAIPNPTGNNYTICHWDTTITDPSRPTHRIPLKTHYPCMMNTQYPLMVFGHASGTSNTWYNYIWEAIVPQGYIVTMPGTFEFLNDSHRLFAADMAYTLQWFFDDCNNTKSCKLYGMIMNKSIVSGHSLGGCDSLLIAGNAININEIFHHQFTCIMTLSGCGVDSNITNYTFAAHRIMIPSLFLTGSSDCMCNPPWNVSIIGYYNDETKTNCKYLGVITNATHCQFQDGTMDDYACDIIEGEFDCHPHGYPGKITRSRQYEIVQTYYALFMYQTLYADNNHDSIQAVKNQLNNDKSNNTMFQIAIDC